VSILDMVGIIPQDEHGLRQTVANVIASLPVTMGELRDARLVAVSGRGRWDRSLALAVEDGATGILLDRPGYLAQAQIAGALDMIAAAGTSVIIRDTWSSHQTVAEAQRLVAKVERPTLLDCLALHDGAQPHADVALALVRLVEAVAGKIQRLVLDSRNAHGFALRAAVGANLLPCSIASAVVPGPGTATLRLLGMDRMLSVEAADSSSWGPIRAFLADQQGEHVIPQHFESPDRVAWKRLCSAVASGQQDMRELQEFAMAAAHVDALQLA
jgi:hypothetical protein